MLTLKGDFSYNSRLHHRFSNLPKKVSEEYIKALPSRASKSNIYTTQFPTKADSRSTATLNQSILLALYCQDSVLFSRICSALSALSSVYTFLLA